MSMAYEEYMKQMVKPMRQELVQSGFKELVSVEDVEQYMESAEGTTWWLLTLFVVVQLV